MHLSAVFSKRIQRFASNQQLFCFFPNSSLSYQDLYRQSTHILIGLRNVLKLRPQDRIAFQCPKSPSWAPFLLACFRNNNIVIPLPMNSPFLNHTLQLTQPKCIVRQDTLDQLLRFPHDPALSDIASDPPVFDADSPVFMLMTSGSSSLPKAVVLSHSNIYHNLRQLEIRFSSSSIDFHRSDLSYSFLPWYHCYGLVGELLFTLWKGTSIYLSGETDPVRNLQKMVFARPTVVQWVPQILYGVERLLDKRALFFSWQTPSMKRILLFGNRLRFITLGGAPCLSRSIQSFQINFDRPLFQGYGCTEMSPMISLNTHGRSFDSVGTCLPRIQHRLDPRTQELQVHGPNRMLGYLDCILPDESLRYTHSFLNTTTTTRTEANSGVSASVKDERGTEELEFYATGDRASVNSDGELKILGRIQDQYKMANGRFVDPNRLETLLEKHPSIHTAFLFSPTGGVYNQVLVYSAQFPHSVSAASLLSDIRQICRDHHIHSSLWPRQIQFLRSPFSTEAQTLSLKLEKRRIFIQDCYHAGTLDLFP